MKKSKFLIFLIIGIFCVFGMAENVFAGGSHNISGWAWSDNIGWISFNNDTDGSAVDYGVNINDITGEFSGHAWSDNAGWISFERAETGVPPEAPYNGAEAYIAELINVNEVHGWAKVLSSNSWILLRDDSNDATVGDGDDVSIDAMGDFHNYAWSDDYGWISFNCETGGPGGADICGTSNYKVSRIDTTPPPDFNVYGFAWSDTIGWVSFNYDNCDENHDGVTDQGNYSQCPIGESVRWYGVDIDEITGKLSGFAWSDKVGWIMFDPLPDHDTGLYPGAPQNSAQVGLISPYKLTGWARACAGTVNGDCASATRDDGWDGWIKLREESDGYGVFIDSSPDPAEFRGSAWGSDIVDYISFNCVDGGTCGVVDYKVYTTLDFIVAEASNLTYLFDNSCAQSRIPTLSWETNTAPFDYVLQIDGGSTTIEETGTISTLTASWAPACQKCCDTLPYNDVSLGKKIYNWRVKVKTEGAMFYSDWVNSTFTTLANCYPNPNFTIDPEDPIIGDEIQLCSTNIAGCPIRESICYSVAGEIPCHTGGKNFLWDIPEIPANGSYIAPDDQTSYNPKIQLDVMSETYIILEITDTGIVSGSGDCSDNRAGCCAIRKDVSPGLPLPEWEEISPSF